MKASDSPIDEPLVIVEDMQEAPAQVEEVAEAIEEAVEEAEACCECKYAAALDLIGAAIEALAEVAKDDQIAKDSIANLGVVMLDLKGTC